MSGYAITLVIGRVGKEPELRYSPNGSGICQFSVAVGRNYKKNGEWAEDTEWYRVVVWDRGEYKAAERAAGALRKGSLVHVVGYMKTREWQDKDGAKHYTTELIADKVQPLADYNKKGPDGEPVVDESTARENVAAARRAFQQDMDELSGLPF